MIKKKAYNFHSLVEVLHPSYCIKLRDAATSAPKSIPKIVQSQPFHLDPIKSAKTISVVVQ